MRVFAVVLLAFAGLCLAQYEPYCLRWNLNTTCSFDTVYPLTTNEDYLSFYQYNAPFGSSANTGLEVSGYSQSFLLKTKVGVLDGFGNPVPPVFTLTTIHDRAQDGSGGYLNLLVNLKNMSFVPQAGDGPILVRDDVGDGYQWLPAVGGRCSSCNTTSPATALGSTCGNGYDCGCDCSSQVIASWVWDKCCTDGITLGPIPDSTNTTLPFWRLFMQYTYNLQRNQTGDLTNPLMSFMFRSYNPGGPTKRIEIPWQNGYNPDFSIEPGSCPPPPNCNLGCFACRRSPVCGWCASTQICADEICDPAFTNCTASARDAACPIEDYCGSKGSCIECNVESLCGWCPATGKCLALESIANGFATCVELLPDAENCTVPAPPAPVPANPVIKLSPSRKPVPAALIGGVIAAGIVLFLLVGILIYKMVRLQSDVIEFVGFTTESEIRTNALYEEGAGFKTNAMYEG